MNIHIGREIETRVKESGIKVSVFAKRINVSQRNIYNLFKRETLPTDQLRLIGEVLNFDFLKLYKPYAEGEPVTVINEPTNSNSKLTLLINLDGSTDTLNKWITTMRAINMKLAEL